jgi:hypothetical protein
VLLRTTVLETCRLTLLFVAASTGCIRYQPGIHQQSAIRNPSMIPSHSERSQVHFQPHPDQNLQSIRFVVIIIGSTSTSCWRTRSSSAQSLEGAGVCGDPDFLFLFLFLFPHSSSDCLGVILHYVLGRPSPSPSPCPFPAQESI